MLPIAKLFSRQRECESSLRKTECVSFPRSGHHALVRGLHRYFGDELRYCEFYQRNRFLEEHGLYSRDVIGRDPLTNFQKNHDFDLKLKIRRDRQYLVQYRHPCECIPSYYKARVADGRIPTDTREQWEAFAREQLPYWKGFMQKWVLRKMNRRLLLCYDDLTDRPEASLAKVVAYLTGSEADGERLKIALNEAPIVRKNVVRGFHHFDEAFFAMMAETCREEILQAPGLQ